MFPIPNLSRNCCHVSKYIESFPSSLLSVRSIEDVYLSTPPGLEPLNPSYYLFESPPPPPPEHALSLAFCEEGTKCRI